MSTASSVSQFMALISGINPSKTQESNAAATEAFQAILQNAQANTNSLQTLQSQLNNVAQQGENAQGSITSLVNLLARNGANDLGIQNQITLELSKKGVPDTTIQKLLNRFGDNELVAILDNPEFLKAIEGSLESQNSDLSDSQIETLFNNVQSVIDQAAKAAKDLTFKPADITDEIVGHIIGADIQNPEEENVTAVVNIVPPVNQEQTTKTIDVAESLIIGQTQSPAQLARGFNPFAQNTSGDNEGDIALPQTLSRSLNGATQGEYVSIADRVNAHNQSTIGQNAQGFQNLSANDFNMIMPGGDGQDFLIDGEGLIPLEASFKTATQATNSLLNTAAAGQSHPATQTVALSLTKFAQKGVEGESDRYRLQLDPPEMGRLDIEMEFIDSTKIKAVVAVEKPETLALLQRDVNSLIKAMQDAGFEGMSQNDLSFNLSQDNNAGEHANRNGNGFENAFQSGDEIVEGDLHVIESEMSIIIDPVTGQKHVNMLV